MFFWSFEIGIRIGMGFGFGLEIWNRFFFYFFVPNKKKLANKTRPCWQFQFSIGAPIATKLSIANIKVEPAAAK